MNKQLLAKWSNLAKVILVVFTLSALSNKANASNGESPKLADSCANAKVDNVDIKLLKTTADYYIISVSTSFNTADYSMRFANGQNEVLYSTELPSKLTEKRYAITKGEEIEDLKIIVSNKKCNVSSTYAVSFVTKETQTLLVSKN